MCWKRMGGGAAKHGKQESGLEAIVVIQESVSLKHNDRYGCEDKQMCFESKTCRTYLLSSYVI